MCELPRGILVHVGLGLAAFGALFATGNGLPAGVIYFGGLAVIAVYCNAGG